MTGFFTKRSSWWGLIISNIVISVGILLVIVYDSPTCVIMGTIIHGIGVGLIMVYSLRYINETSPREVSGPAGALFHVFICLGILISSIVYKCMANS